MAKNKEIDAVDDKAEELVEEAAHELENENNEVDIDEEEGDKRLSADAEELDDGNDEEREKIRERRRIERKLKKQHAREARARNEHELQTLRQQTQMLQNELHDLKRNQTVSVVDTIDSKMKTAEQAYKEAESAFVRAVEQNDAQAQLLAMNVRDRAKETYMTLYAQKGRIVENHRAPQQERMQNEAPPDRRIIANYRKFQAKNPWYDPNGRDAESARLQKIDEGLSAEGWDPKDGEYWQELEHRAKKSMPHLFDEDDEETYESRPSRRTPPVGAGSQSNNGGSAKVSLSSTRVAALRLAAGDDPEKLKRLIGYAKKFDKENPRNSSR